MKNFSFLNLPVKLLDKKPDRYLLIIVVLLFSVVFLNVFEPFNIARWYSDSGLIQFLRLSGYGVIIALVFLFTQFPLRKIFNVQQFTVKTYILWLTIEFALINLAYIFIYGNPIGNFKNDFFFSLKYTLMSIWLPYSFAILIIHYKNHRAEIAHLKTGNRTPATEHLAIFRDENGKMKFSVQKPDLLLLESTDNYVSVFYLLGNKVQRTLLRNTLKNLEGMLSETGLIRCHRSFMVNPANIEFMQREGRKLNIKLRYLDKPVPVSEKYSPLFMAFLS
jgi:hypothetical protein